MSPHAWLILGLCFVPLLILLPLWLLDADRAPRNEITQEQPEDADDPGPAALPLAA